MTRKVLLEAYNVALPGGTGIATYTMNLAEAAKSNGYAVDGLLHANSGLARDDALLREVDFYDARNLRPSWFALQIESNWRRGIGVPLGIGAQRLFRSGLIVDSGAASLRAVEIFDKTYVARLFMDFSRFHFSRYGRAARLKLPEAPDLFHATQMIPLKVPKAANIYTIHDLVPILLPYTTLDDKRFFLSAVRHLCKTADHIVTVSEKSKTDIMALTGMSEDRITNTYQAVSIPADLLAQSENDLARLIERRFGLVYKQYYLFCGALEPKKNLLRLLGAYADSGSEYPLVLAGPLGWDYQEILESIQDERFAGRPVNGSAIRPQRMVRRLNYLPYAHLISLMRGARALLFPSLYEGFGLPVLEAMSVGTPVITSNSSSLVEVAGDAAILVDPLDIGALANAIHDVDNDQDLRRELGLRGLRQASKFSAEAYHKRIGALYGHVLGSAR